MSLGKKFMKFCSDNVVMITCGSVIIGVHWGWYKLQDVPSLVDPSEKKEIPIVIGAKYLADSAVKEYHQLVDGKPEETIKAK